VSLPGFKFREGIVDWRVLTEKLDTFPEDTDYFMEFKTFEEIPADYHKCRCLKDTMFPNFYDENIRRELTKCLRVMPHDQNTSGFFITII
jgi:16S rRNA C967 or C1407 C5-methylase (RsmB/RsmF family)